MLQFILTSWSQMSAFILKQAERFWCINIDINIWGCLQWNRLSEWALGVMALQLHTLIISSSSGGRCVHHLLWSVWFLKKLHQNLPQLWTVCVCVCVSVTCQSSLLRAAKNVFAYKRGRDSLKWQTCSVWRAKTWLFFPSSSSFFASPPVQQRAVLCRI